VNALRDAQHDAFVDRAEDREAVLRVYRRDGTDGEGGLKACMVRGRAADQIDAVEARVHAAWDLLLLHRQAFDEREGERIGGAGRVAALARLAGEQRRYPGRASLAVEWIERDQLGSRLDIVAGEANAGDRAGEIATGRDFTCGRAADELGVGKPSFRRCSKCRQIAATRTIEDDEPLPRVVQGSMRSGSGLFRVA